MMEQKLLSDLHIHTTASDGVFTPSQVVLRAKERELSCIAISDHDSVAGIAEARIAAQQAKIRLIPAVEISAGGEQEIHILGYGLPLDNEQLNAFLQRMADDRLSRAQAMLAKLAKLGKPLQMDESPCGRNSVIGRPQIARAMIARGYVQDMQQAFARYLGNGCPAYVPRTYLDPAEAIAFLRSLGAVPVLAHPGLLHWPDEKMAEALPIWQQAGLLGMEVYHPAHAPDAFNKWEACARAHHLLVTSGSDFHSLGDQHADIGDMCPYWPAVSKDTQMLLDALEQARQHA